MQDQPIAGVCVCPLFRIFPPLSGEWQRRSVLVVRETSNGISQGVIENMEVYTAQGRRQDSIMIENCERTDLNEADRFKLLCFGKEIYLACIIFPLSYLPQNCDSGQSKFFLSAAFSNCWSWWALYRCCRKSFAWVGIHCDRTPGFFGKPLCNRIAQFEIIW